MSLVIRPVKLMDTHKLVVAINTNLDFLKNFSFFQKPVTIDGEVEYISRSIGSKSCDLQVMELSGQIIGTIGLHEISLSNRSTRLGLVIFSPEHRGHHYGTEAITQMLNWAFEPGIFCPAGLNQVYITVWAENDPALKHYNELGFIERGTLPDWYCLDGVFHDVKWSSILQRDWEKKNKS